MKFEIHETELGERSIEVWSEARWRELRDNVAEDVRSIIDDGTIISQPEIDRLGAMIQVLSMGCDAAEEGAKEAGARAAVAIPTEIARALLCYATLQIVDMAIENYDKKAKAALQ
jgi:hypothetical protein